MKNKLGYLGFLGLLGFVGLFAHNYVYCALFVFLYFLRFFWVIPDELFQENIRKAATPAFFLSMIIYAFTAALTAFHVSTFVYIIGLVLGFALPFVLFAILLTVFEYKENAGEQS